MIYGKRIRLRAPEREDLPLFVEWLNDPEVRQGLGHFLPMSNAREERWFEDMLKRPPETHPLTIEVMEGNSWVTIGNLGLFDIHPRAHSAEVGIMIGNKNYWDKGYGTEAMELVLQHGFETLNLHRIMLHVYAFNPRAIRSYEKAGFVEEGRMRQSVYAEGTYHDTILMSILREEWDGRKLNKESGTEHAK
jgi:RimJ/RimL family protein N-acetyltransferase